MGSYVIDGTSYSNNTNYYQNILSISAPTNFPTNAQIRFYLINNAGNSNDRFFIDEIIIADKIYCSSYGNDTDNYYTGIRQVAFNTIANATPVEDNDYSNFTSISTDVERNTSYNLTVNVNTDGNYRVHVFAWIDWNQDGDFFDSGETYDLGDIINVSNGALSTSITVPSSASLGTTRMRVAAKWNNNPTACETNFDGEVEDYSINVLASSPYCTPININNYNTYFISNVSLGTINNTTAGTTGSYNDYTAIAPLNVTAGQIVTGTISVNINGWNTSTNDLNVWIDLNQDGDFNDTGENYLVSVTDTNNIPGIKTVVVSVNIPIATTATAGNTRMRIGFIHNDGSTYNACNFDYNSGEIEDYLINVSSCSINNWTGLVSDNWNISGNWGCGRVPSITFNDNVLIPFGAANYPIIYSAGNDGFSNNLEVESGAKITVIDNSLEVHGLLTLNGIIDLEGQGQLLQTTTSTLLNSSTGYIERDQQGQGSRYRYNDWSSPVIQTNTALGTPFTVANVLRDGTNPSSPGSILYTDSYDGSKTPFTISNYWIYKFANAPDGSYSNWNQIGSTGNLHPGEGFLMKGPGNAGSADQNYVFIGKPNNGTISINLNGNNDYLVGNPYPSAIDANQFILDNANTLRDGTLYFWDHYGGNSHNLKDYQAGYAYYNLSGGTVASAHAVVNQSVPSGSKEPKRYIPVGQGFFVWGDADGGTIEFNNGQRVFVTEDDPDYSLFMKSATSNKQINSSRIEADTRPKIKLGFMGQTIDYRQILLTIDENATNGADYGYDSEIYEIFEDDMFWTIADKKYVIQGTNTFTIDDEISLGVNSSGGIVTIKVHSLENIPESTAFYIKDNVTNLTHEIKNDTFQIDLPAGEYLNRFSLVFKTQNTLSVADEVLNTQINVFMNNVSKEIKVSKTTDQEIETIVLYNNLGQALYNWKPKFSGNEISLPVQVSSGIYFVQVHTNTNKLSKKIVVN
jgi:hypothetical protein